MTGAALVALLRRELALAWGRGGGPLFACAFYVGLATLLPLAEGPTPQKLAADGALDLLTLGPLPLEVVTAVKCLAQWLANGVPLALAAPIVSIALGAEPRLWLISLVASLGGGLGFTFVGGIGAALVLGARRGGLLIAVVVLPLFAPPVIFGAGAVEAFGAGLEWKPALAFLLAYSLAAAGLAPIAMAAACRNALS
jgi:heme exporter protein B